MGLSSNSENQSKGTNNWAYHIIDNLHDCICSGLSHRGIGEGGGVGRRNVQHPFSPCAPGMKPLSSALYERLCLYEPLLFFADFLFPVGVVSLYSTALKARRKMTQWTPLSNNSS